MANRINYQLEMEKVLAALPTAPKPRLLLHACCAPCSSAVLERLKEHFEITILYYNPNIDPPAEFYRRQEELAQFLQKAGYLGIALIRDCYAPAEFYTAVQGLETEPERGGRCTVCYRLRMERAAAYAKEHGFDWFTTTLSISPLKDPVRINEIGQALEQKYGVRHLPSEFRKKNGYLRSLQLSSEYGLYRQDYCGCKFSRKAREKSDAGAAQSGSPAAPAADGGR